MSPTYSSTSYKDFETQIEKVLYYFCVLHIAYTQALGIELLNFLTLCGAP